MYTARFLGFESFGFRVSEGRGFGVFRAFEGVGGLVLGFRGSGTGSKV